MALRKGFMDITLDRIHNSRNKINKKQNFKEFPYLDDPSLGANGGPGKGEHPHQFVRLGDVSTVLHGIVQYYFQNGAVRRLPATAALQGRLGERPGKEKRRGEED